MSVFLPECGLSQEILNRSELVEILALKSDDIICSQPESTPLLLDIVERIKHNKSLNAGFTKLNARLRTLIQLHSLLIKSYKESTYKFKVN
jgi:hypothetical protein